MGSISAALSITPSPGTIARSAATMASAAVEHRLIRQPAS